MKSQRNPGIMAFVLTGALFLKVFSAWAETADEYFLRTGKAYDIKQGKFSQVASDYAKAVEAAKGYTREGILSAKQVNLDRVLLDLAKAIEINPNYAQAYYDRALTYVALDNFIQAISDCTKVIEMNPNFTEAYSVRSSAYSIIQEHDKALADALKAKELGGAVNPSTQGISRK